MRPLALSTMPTSSCCGAWAQSWRSFRPCRRRSTCGRCPLVARRLPRTAWGGGRKPAMLSALRKFHAAHKPILAECGGMLYCFDSLVDLEGRNTGSVASCRCGRHAGQTRLPGHAVRAAAAGRVSRPRPPSLAQQWRPRAGGPRSATPPSRCRRSHLPGRPV